MLFEVAQLAMAQAYNNVASLKHWSRSTGPIPTPLHYA